MIIWIIDCLMTLGNQGDLDDFIKKMRPKMTAVLT